jgi:hypothetical protein
MQLFKKAAGAGQEKVFYKQFEGKGKAKELYKKAAGEGQEKVLYKQFGGVGQVKERYTELYTKEGQAKELCKRVGHFLDQVTGLETKKGAFLALKSFMEVEEDFQECVGAEKGNYLTEGVMAMKGDYYQVKGVEAMGGEYQVKGVEAGCRCDGVGWLPRRGLAASQQAAQVLGEGLGTLRGYVQAESEEGRVAKHVLRCVYCDGDPDFEDCPELV